MRRPRVPGERSETRDPGRHDGSSILPCNPGSRHLRSRCALARPGHEGGVAAHAVCSLARSEPPPVRNSRCQTAQSSSFPRRVRARGLWPCLVWCRRRNSAAVADAAAGRARLSLGDSGRSGPLMRGGRSADRRTRLFCSVARARRDHRASAARHRPVASGTPLGAPPWRFSAGDPRCRLRQWDTGAASDLSAPGREAWRTGSRTSGAAVRAAASDATPRSACRIVSGDAPQERGCECLSQLRYVVNSEVESQSKFFACSGCESRAAGRTAAPSPREPRHRYDVGARDA